MSWHGVFLTFLTCCYAKTFHCVSHVPTTLKFAPPNLSRLCLWRPQLTNGKGPLRGPSERINCCNPEVALPSQGVQVIRPRLHHLGALFEVLGPVVCPTQ